MMPLIPFSTPSPTVLAFARVDKATSEFLSAPDWRINIAICDTINDKYWLARDFVKAVKVKLQHKNPNVQILALTLLETLVNNCGDHIHTQIAERKLLPEMIKIVKRKTHMRVREKILMLIDSWQEAFGGRGGKPPHYYLAYEELRHKGVEFPQRSPNAVPILTPPAIQCHPQQEATTSGIENLSFSTMESMKNVSNLLSEMLQAVDPKDRTAVKDEVIVDLADQCRSNQKKLMPMIASTADEELLREGIELNETLQYVIEKHDAIASGSPLPSCVIGTSAAQSSQLEPSENGQEKSNSSALVVCSPMNEAQDKQDDNTPIPTRQSETRSVAKNKEMAASDPALNMALVVLDPPPPANGTNAQDMIDFLSLALSPANTTPPVSATEVPVNSYVVPWAQAQPEPQAQDLTTPQELVQEQSCYIPPPWAPTPGYYYNPSSPAPGRPSSYYNNAPLHGDGAFIPSYRLFEDLNVLNNVRTNSSPGTSGHGMMSAKK